MKPALKSMQGASAGWVAGDNCGGGGGDDNDNDGNDD
jgi:hypothetical protein